MKLNWIYSIVAIVAIAAVILLCQQIIRETERGKLKLYSKFYKKYTGKKLEKYSYSSDENLRQSIYEYYNMIGKNRLKSKKYELNSNVYDFKSSDLSGYFVLALTIILTFTIAILTFKVNADTQHFFINYQLIMTKNRDIRLNSQEISIIDLELSLNKGSSREILLLKKKNLLNENDYLVKERKMLESGLNDSGKEIESLFKDYKENFTFSIMIYLVAISILAAIMKYTGDKYDIYKKRFYGLCLEILEEVERKESNNEEKIKDKHSFSELTITMNQAIKDADNTIKKAYESLEEVNRNVKFLEYTTIRGTNK